MTHRNLFLPVGIVVLTMLPAAAAAQVEQRFRIQGTWSNPTDELRETDVDGDVVIEAEDVFGGRLGYEVLFSERWGIELGVGTSRHDVAVEAGGFGLPTSRIDFARLRITPITASLLYHFTPQAKADFFVGGGAAYVDYGDFEITLDDLGGSTPSFAVDSDLTYALQAGLDLELNDRWALTGNVQWIDTDAEFEVSDDDEGGDDGTLPISPVVVGAGIAFRF